MERLVRMLEQDAPLLAVRVEPLSPERQQSAKSYAEKLAVSARAELNRLMEERTLAETADLHPQAAD